HDTDRPPLDVKRIQYLYPANAANILPIEEGAEIQDAGIWQTSVPYFPVKHTEYLFPSFTIDWKALTQPERPTPDKWQPETGKPLFDVKRTQWVYPTFAIDAKQLMAAERSSPDKWQPDTNKPL